MLRRMSNFREMMSWFSLANASCSESDHFRILEKRGLRHGRIMVTIKTGTPVA
jgi:hypothetical protein